MDPKGLPNLDPKLKEAYERVMSTSISSSAPSAPTTASAPTPAPQATAPAQAAPTPAAVASSPVAAPQPTSIPQSTSASTFVAGNTPAASSGSKISPVLLVIAGIIFFAVYTLFWLRFFNIPLPFLP